jgi:hypothetical protein
MGSAKPSESWGAGRPSHGSKPSESWEQAVRVVGSRRPSHGSRPSESWGAMAGRPNHGSRQSKLWGVRLSKPSKIWGASRPSHRWNFVETFVPNSRRISMLKLLHKHAEVATKNWALRWIDGGHRLLQNHRMNGRNHSNALLSIEWRCTGCAPARRWSLIP